MKNLKKNNFEFHKTIDLTDRIMKNSEKLHSVEEEPMTAEQKERFDNLLNYEKRLFQWAAHFFLDNEREEKVNKIKKFLDELNPNDFIFVIETESWPNIWTIVEGEDAI
jgi:hypothetical protein